MKRYNGWTNWETWNTSLWLNNEEHSYKLARRICKNYDATHAKYMLQELAQEIIPKNEGINYSDVNWEEIINDFNEE